MILAVDAGNSRVKWAYHDGSAFTQEGSTALVGLDALSQQWSQLPEPPAAIVVANVAGEGVRRRLQALFSAWAVEPRWVAGQRSQCGVTSFYDDPAQLGPDRWAAVVGARQLVKISCLVINAGTAMTVDGLTAKGEFLGGIIVPGFDLMHESLSANTARLSAQRGEFSAFPRFSADAITSGAIQALCGAVERMSAEMIAAGHDEPALLIGGGTGALIARHLKKPARTVDKLVLEGLVCIAREGQ